MLVVLYVCLTSYLIGYTNCILEGKIVGGHVPNITEFPYVAHLGIQCEIKITSDILIWICSSSILNQNLLLTAAHCLAECSPNSFVSVSVGHIISKKGWQSSGHSYLVHEYYYPDLTINDIGLVKLKTSLTFNAYVNRVVLMNKPPYNENARVAGWGVIDEKLLTFGEELKYIDQHVWDLLDCLDLLKSIPPGTFCASSNNENYYPARGDSGSALVVRKYIQIGLVSYKKPETSNNVIIYTDTGFFYDWIKEKAMLLNCGV